MLIFLKKKTVDKQYRREATFFFKKDCKPRFALFCEMSLLVIKVYYILHVTGTGFTWPLPCKHFVAWILESAPQLYHYLSLLLSQLYVNVVYL